MAYTLPQNYNELKPYQRREVRLQYMEEQDNKCYYCNESLYQPVPKRITDKVINWKLFPKEFLKYSVHLQHNHTTGMTEGAVHAYCNAVMWQYEGR